MSKIIGIDLGTTNSCVAVMKGDKPVVIINPDGGRTTPSVVAFTKTDELIVGDSARRQAVTNSGKTISSIKRHMGSDFKVTIDDKRYSPQEISAMILKELKSDAESYLREPVEEAVIAVPTYFNDAQRQATKVAGELAGLNVIRIINEPSAAALAYSLDNESEQEIMVYDLGGGSLSVSVIGISDGVIEVLATAGNNRLGGDDFDDHIMKYIIDEFKKAEGIDLSADEMAVQRLKEAAEKAKKDLSTRTQTNINLPFITVTADGPKHLDINLTRAKFDELTKDLVEATKEPIQATLRDADLSTNDLDKVLLVGGATRIPAVQRLVKQVTGKEPSKTLNADECIAIGAAIQGSTLAGKDDFKSKLLVDVTPLTLSIETLDGIATPLIEKNTIIPTSKSQVFSTKEDGQTAVDINVVQGEGKLVKDNTSLGRFKLEGIPSASKGVPQIKVTFDIDINGILNVSAKDLSTGKKKQILFTAGKNLFDEYNAKLSAQKSRVISTMENEKPGGQYDSISNQQTEFDNYRRRTEKEKKRMLEKGEKNVIERILPVIDNIERGFDMLSEEEKTTPFVEGMKKVYKQMMTELEALGVKEIEALNCKFDPAIHNAVTHVEDEKFDENTVIEVFQKGYYYKDTVVRYSQVKVAN